MNKPLVSAFFVVLGIILIFAYGYLPPFIGDSSLYSTLFNGLFITGIVVSFLMAIGIAVRS